MNRCDLKAESPAKKIPKFISKESLCGYPNDSNHVHIGIREAHTAGFCAGVAICIRSQSVAVLIYNPVEERNLKRKIYQLTDTCATLQVIRGIPYHEY